VFFKTNEPVPVCRETGWGIIETTLFCAEEKKKHPLKRAAIVINFMSYN
jgi:hypothetical protein